MAPEQAARSSGVTREFVQSALDRIAASLADKLASMRNPEQIRGLIYAHLEEAVRVSASGEP
jgi:hypothetical protein